jgi:hypothetical protein
MSAPQKSRPAKPPVDARYDSVIGSAAGAIMRADEVALMLDAPDEEVGRRLKDEVRRLRSELNLVPSGNKDIVVGRTHEVDVELPAQEHFPDDDVSASDVLAESQASRRKLVETGELVMPAQLQSALSMSRQAVSFAVREKRFFRVDVDGQDYFPAFFVHANIDRRVLERVAKELDTLPGWLKWDFFTAPRETLGGATVLEALARGKEELVREVARRFVAEGAV